MPMPGKQHWFLPDTFPTLGPTTNNCRVDLLHAALGMAGEAGEVIEHVKKSMFYGKPLDEAKLKEEAGDLLWYIAGPLCRALGCTLEELAAANVAKLEKRYPEKYSDLAALRRVDVNEPKPRPEVLAATVGMVRKKVSTDDLAHVLLAYDERYGSANVDDRHYFDEEAGCWFPIPELWEELHNGS